MLVHFSNDHNVVSSLICRHYKKLAMDFLATFLSKIEFRFRRKKILIIAINCNSTINNLQVFNFQVFIAFDSTCSRLY